MDHKTSLILLFLLIGVSYIIVVSIFRLYKNLYFRSKDFEELNRMTDDIAEEYEIVTNLSCQFKQSLFTNFSPSMFNQCKMRNDIDIPAKEMRKLPPRTYLCTKEIINKFESQPYDILKEHCGFSESDNVMYRLEDIHRQARNLERAVGEFEEEYEKQLSVVKKSAPSLIRLFSKNQLLLLLGLYVKKDWKENIYPKYTFRDMEDYTHEICIILTPKTLKEIIDYLSAQSKDVASFSDILKTEALRKEDVWHER